MKIRLLNIMLAGILLTLATAGGARAGNDAPAGNRVVAVADKWPITGRDLKLELFFVCLERGGTRPELVEMARNGFAGDVPGTLGEELLHKVIERRLILKDMEKSRHFQANIEDREVKARLENWDAVMKDREILSQFSRWLDLDRSELLIQARENLLVEKYVSQELGVFGSTGKKLEEIYNKWANILWNRAEIEIF
ncbi:MAG: hypothetical protein PHE84_02280 [bacterium]|nr:hypothetical protein [bacterium]